MKKTTKVKRSRTEKAALYICFAIFFIYALTLIWPFVWMGSNAGKTQIEFYRNKLSLPANYVCPIFPMLCLRSMSQQGAGTGTHQVKLIQMFGNSIYLTIILTVLEVFVSACTAYVITYYRFPGRKIIYGMVILRWLYLWWELFPSPMTFFHEQNFSIRFRE